ncbi:MAG: DHHW family protein [Negativibacillus sp.]|nr:DHHW family protein [Negativibacillus sp.]
MKKILQYPIAVLFALFISVFFLVDVFNSDRAFSEFENTSLAQKPAFSWSSFVDGSFGSKYVKYINEQFLGRDNWISMKAVADMGLGRIESHGVTYGDDHYLMEKLEIVEDQNYPANAGTNIVKQTALDRSNGMVSSFLQMYDQPITFSLVPNSYAILEDEVPTGFPGADQQAYTQQIYRTLSEVDDQLEIVDFSDALSQHKDEYIYYRTDHHWTTLGAYYAYVAYCEQKGLTPVSLEELKENKVEDFYGTFYSKAKRPSQPADTITWYDVDVDEFAFVANLQQDKQLAQLGEVVQEDGLELLRVDGMMDQRKFEVRDKYAAFMWGNSGYVKIKSNHNLNHQEGKTSRLLLFKDSYANSMIPYLTYNYDEIIVVDLRYMAKSTKELMQEEFDDIFVMYNFSTYVSGASDLAKLKF